DAGVTPVVVVNKIDKPQARPEAVVDEVLEVFIDLGADDEQLEFPVVYASAMNGTASLDPDTPDENMQVVYDTILENVRAAIDNSQEPLQFQVALLDYTYYVGRIGVGRVFRGDISEGEH